MRYRFKLLLALSVLLSISDIAYPQSQIAVLEIYRQNSPSFRLLDGTKLTSSRTRNDFTWMRDTFNLGETFGADLTVLAPCPVSMLFYLTIGQDTFSYKLENGNIFSESDIINYQLIQVGDSIEVIRTSDAVILLHNQLLLDSIPYAGTSLVAGAGLRTLSGNSCQVQLRLRNQSSGPRASLYQFLDTLMAVQEGQSITPRVGRVGSQSGVDPQVHLLSMPSPHYDGFSSIPLSFGANDTILFNLASDLPNGIDDDNNTYLFTLSSNDPLTLIGDRATLKVVVADDAQDSVTALCPGAIVITAIDNHVEQVDRISLTALKPIYPNTSFSVATAIYQQTAGPSNGRWYASDGVKSSEIASQKITYTGGTTLSPGTIICFEVPDSGQSTLLVSNFEINGISTTDLNATNDGIVQDPNINLNIDHPEAIFVLQGSWRANPEYAEFLGQIIHGVQIGSEWFDGVEENPPFISDRPEQIDCFIPEFNGDLEIAVHFDCGNTLDIVSTLTILDKIVDATNWTYEIPTSANDLPISVCTQPCDLQELDTIWYISVEDLIIPCTEAANSNTIINAWLAANGNGEAFSSCGLEGITNDYGGLNLTCGTSGNATVIFTAVDSCGHSFSDSGQITIMDQMPPEWSRNPDPLTLSCSDSAKVDSTIQEWLLRYGDGSISDACNLVTVSNDFQPQNLPCDTTIIVSFTATDDCGNWSLVQGQIQISDIVPPIFVSAPSDLFLFCDRSYIVQDTITFWLSQFGYGVATDDCSNVNENSSVPGGLTSLACPADTSFLVTFYADDQCDNFSSRQAYVHIKSTTDPCDTSVSLEIIGDSLKFLDYSCSGYQEITWQYRAPSDTSWLTYAVGMDTTAGISFGEGYYRVIARCHGECQLIRQTFFNPCEGLNMVIEDSAIGLKWGELSLDTVPVENYLISWVNENEEEIFRSAAGAYFDSISTLPHPFPVFQPVPAGSYRPIIIESDHGSNLDCFSPVTIEPITCQDEYSYSYNGPAGQALHQTTFLVEDSVYLKFWLKTDFLPINEQGNPERLLVTYGSDTILDTDFVFWKSPRIKMVQVPFSPGVNQVEVMIENEGDIQKNTKYDLRIKCCSVPTTCAEITNNEVVFNPPILNGRFCTMTSDPDTSWTMEYFWGNYCIDVEGLSFPNSISSYASATSCVFGGPVFTDSCASGLLTINNLSSVGISSGSGVVINFSSSLSDSYNLLKDKIIESESIFNRSVRVVANDFLCNEDTSSRTTIALFPYAATTTFDDMNRRIIHIYDDMNPYDTSTVPCIHLIRNNFGFYSSIFSHNSTHSSLRTYNSVLEMAQIETNSSTSQGFAGRNEKSFSSSMCNIRQRYELKAYDYACPCETWLLVADLDNDLTYETRLDSSGLTSCTSLDLSSEEIISRVVKTDERYFHYYPNPTSSNLTVEFMRPGDDEAVTVSIYDLGGKQLTSHPFQAIRGYNVFSLNTSKLPEGMYILHLHGERFINSGRFTIIH